MTFKTAIAKLSTVRSATAHIDAQAFDIGAAIAAIAAEVMDILDDKDYAYVAEDLCDWLSGGEYKGNETAEGIAAEYMAY